MAAIIGGYDYGMATRETQVTCPAGAIVGTSDGAVREFHSIPYARFTAALDPPAPAPTGMLIDATPPPHPLTPTHF